MDVNHSVLVRADVERVYDALTAAAGLDGWFTGGAEINLRPGGFIRFRWVDWGVDHYSGEDEGPILEVNRPGLFVFQWHPDGPIYATTVRIDTVAAPGGTIVRLSETGFQDSPSGVEAALRNATGWGEALTLLKFWVEHGVRY